VKYETSNVNFNHIHVFSRLDAIPEYERQTSRQTKGRIVGRNSTLLSLCA